MLFWMTHVRNNYEIHCVLILDNLSGQTHFSAYEKSILPEQLNLLYLPPNVTSHHHTCDMGIIASVKVGYKSELLRKLLTFFDIPGGYEKAATERA